jgi:hypothetical protein
MPFTKTWLGTTGDYELSTNWELISLRDSGYAWTASGSGTNEYYVRTAASGNPGFVATPPTTTGVYIAGSAATKGTLGSLTAGQWGYGDNDALGYSTVYVRLSGGGDPDAQDADHVQFRQIPQATEHVRIPAGSGAISSNLDQSAVAIGDFIVEEGHEGSIGSTLGYLLIDPNRFEYTGNGQAFIDLTTAAISPRIIATVSATFGERGLYLKGSALDVIDMQGGQVGLAIRPGETATATTIRMQGSDASLWIGNGVTLTNLHQYSGEAVVRCAVTTTILYGGELATEENGAHTTVTQYGGEYIWTSSGNITTYNMYAGVLDMQKSGAARTLSTLNKFPGSLTIRRNKEAVTITAEAPQASYTENISVA